MVAEIKQAARRATRWASRRGARLRAAGRPRSHVHWDRKLDGLLAQALMSIQAVKGVEIATVGTTPAGGQRGPRCHLVGRRQLALPA